MLEAIFAPQSVAIVGASPDPSKLGHRVLRNIVDNGYAGRVFPVHHNRANNPRSARIPLGSCRAGANRPGRDCCAAPGGAGGGG